MKNILDNNSIKFLEEYLNSFSPSGDEKEGQKVWKNYIQNDVQKIYKDLYGTFVAVINPNSPKKLVIEAHADEISWYVNYITEDGFIYVSRNGGIDHQIALSKKVIIHTEKGPLYGIFGWPAIHTRKSYKEDKNLSVDKLFIDIGVNSKKEALKLGVHVGCLVSYPNQFFILNKNFFVSKALDNKIGGFIIAEVIKMIVKHSIDLKYGLYIVNSVQEEIGLKGAKMISHNINPDIAIVTDVTHDTSIPMIDKKTDGDIKCGSGPVITYAPSIIKKIRDLITNTAETKKINFQRLVTEYATGTDHDIFAYSGNGILSALISVPLKYMHTTVEMVNIKDVENTILLIFESLKKINDNFESFFSNSNEF